MAGNKPPLYSGKYKARELLSVQGINLFRWSEQHDNSVWEKNNLTVAPNTIVAPDGKTTANKIFGIQDSIGGNISQTVHHLPFNTNYNFSTYLKPAGLNYVAVTIEALSSSPISTANVGHATIILDLSSGLISETVTTLSAFYDKKYSLEIFPSTSRSIISNDKLDTWTGTSFVGDISSNVGHNILPGYTGGLRNSGPTSDASGVWVATRETLTPTEQELIDATYFLRLSANGSMGTTPVHQILDNSTGSDSHLIIGATPPVYAELAGKTVTTSFWARASKPTKIFSESQVHAPGYSMWTPVQWQVYDLTTEWQKFYHTRVFPTTAQVAQVAYDPNAVFQSILTDPNNPVYTPLTASGSLPPLSAWNDQIDIKLQWSLASHRMHGNHANRPDFLGTAMPDSTLQEITESVITDGYYDIALPRFELGDASSLNDDWIRFSVAANPFTEDVDNTLTSPITCSIKTTITPLTASTDEPQTAVNGNNNTGLYIWGSQLEKGDVSSLYTFTENSQEWRVFKYGGQAGNLIYFSQNFNEFIDLNGDNIGWYKTNIGQILSAAEISPRGFLEASKILENNTDGKHQLRHEKSEANDGLYTASIYAKKAERRYIQISQEHTSVPAIFDLQDGIVTQSGDFETYIQYVGGGWYRCEAIYVNRPGPDFKIMSFGPCKDSTGNASYVGDPSSGIFVWGAQVERTGWAGEHIITAGAPFTRLSHYDFSNQETVEPSLTMPYNFNHLYWSDVYDDIRSTWNLSNSAQVILQRPEITNTPNGELVPISMRLPDSLNLASNLIEGTNASPTGFGMSQTHQVKYEWDEPYDGRWTFSVFVKGDATSPLKRYIRIDLDALTITNVFFGRVSTVIDLALGEIVQPAEAVGNAFIPKCVVEYVDDGWYRVSLTGFFGEPTNKITGFDGTKLITFANEDILTFAQIEDLLKDFDIRGAKQIRPRVILSNGPEFDDINYTGNQNYIKIWGAQLEAGPKATPYTTNTTGKTRSYDATLTRVKSDTTYYLPIIRYARDETTFQFQTDATYDRTRRTTGNETLILYNNKVGFNNPNPTFSVDISGSLRAATALVPVVSTASLDGDDRAPLNINKFNEVNINSSVDMGSNILTTSTLSATDIVTATTVYQFSTLNIPVPITEEEFNVRVLEPGAITQNFTVSDILSAKTLTTRESFLTPELYADVIDVTDNFQPINGTALSNISPKNVLSYTEDFRDIYWLPEDTIINPNVTTAPDGTNTADKFSESSTFNYWPRVSNRNGIYTTSDRPYVYSIYAKQSGSRYFAIDIRENSKTISRDQLITPHIAIVYDLVNGTIAMPLTATPASEAISATIIPQAENWYRLAIVFKPNVTPILPRDPSNLTIRHSILSNTDPATLNALYTILEPPGNRDVDPTNLRFTGNDSNGILIWGAQLEYAGYETVPALTEYEKIETVSPLPDIYTNRIIGKVPIDPALTNPVGYNPREDLRVDRDINVVFGIKPSDSFSTDNPTVIRALTGDWDFDHNADELGVARPFFKNWWGVIDYVRTSGLSFGNSLTILVYEDILGNSAPVNPSPWSNTLGDPLYNPTRYNPEPTTPSDPSGLRLSNTATGTRLARRWGGGTGFECDVYSTEWLGANYPALTAAGLRGGTYTWRSGNYERRQDQSLWIPGRAFEIRRDINYANINIEGIYNIKPRIGSAAPSAPASYNAPNNEYLAYYIKDKPFDEPPRKLITRSFICQDRLKNFDDGRTTTTNNGGGYFGEGDGDPSLFLNCQYYIDEDDNRGRFDRAHLNIFDMRPTSVCNFKNICYEQQHNATDATSLWTLGNFNFANTTIVNQANTIYNHWGSGILLESFSGGPASKYVFNGTYQIDPYFLTPETWNSEEWRNIKGATSKAYMPGYGLAVVGSMPYTVVNGVTANPFKPLPGYSFFHSRTWRPASMKFSDIETPDRQFGRNSRLQGSLILDGEFCQQANTHHMSLFDTRLQGTTQTDGYIFKGDNFAWLNRRLGLVATGINNRARTPTHEFIDNYTNLGVFMPVRGGAVFANLFTTSAGVAPWKLDGSLPPASAYPGTALYKKNYTFGTWETRWFVGRNSDFSLADNNDYDPPIIDFTGYMTPTDWLYNKSTNVISITAASTSNTFTIPTTYPDGEPVPDLLPIGINGAYWRWSTLTVDGYNVPRTSYKIDTSTRSLFFEEWTGIRYSNEDLNRDITEINTLSAMATYLHLVSATNVTTLDIEPGPKMTSNPNDYKVTMVRYIADGSEDHFRPYTRTYTVLNPATEYTVNSATRTFEFTSPIPITQVLGTPIEQLSGREPFNCYTRISIEQLTVAQGSVMTLQWYPLPGEMFTDNLLNSVIEQKPYWTRTADNRFILSGHRSPNDMDSYRDLYTIESPLSEGLFSTLVYYTSTNTV